MKLFFFCFTLIFCSTADETKDLIEGALKSCGAQIDGPNNIGKLVLEQNADEAKLGATIFCANKKINLQHTNGDINLDVLGNFLTTGNRDEETAKKIMDCGRAKGDSGATKAFNFLKCHEMALKN
ncbi:uncharacterized protein LOC130900034 [Diorhabda carinulata]|uniref:uncharacterized protein LOC130900034 n=1 Tax=Diorhabda carinulata TaxID=1163345 RepID=UPI0025A21ABE|nr:uncharacterized protein LOC130900034 [Diorhabda carinulata]